MHYEGRITHVIVKAEFKCSTCEGWAVSMAKAPYWEGQIDGRAERPSEKMVCAECYAAAMAKEEEEARAKAEVKRQQRRWAQGKAGP